MIFVKAKSLVDLLFQIKPLSISDHPGKIEEKSHGWVTLPKRAKGMKLMVTYEGDIPFRD